jgi:hypothetical protein
MSEPWGPHDVGGQDGGPVDVSDHDTAHWEWQIDAMVRMALKKGLISDFAELRDGIEKLTPDDYENSTYYERWASALAYALVERGVITEKSLADKAQSIRERQEADA